jgi:hypothetical protein
MDKPDHCILPSNKSGLEAMDSKWIESIMESLSLSVWQERLIGVGSDQGEVNRYG